MALHQYKEKRNFTKTPEPQVGKSKDSKRLIFVVQKHEASHLHYDFRLEMDGVLKSWAVPKGLSNDPAVKRLAIMVEDHPFDYRNFEGIIPEGQYGGGTVIVWDQGYYEPLEEIKSKKGQEKELLKQLDAGSLKIRLHGEKLQGEFALVKTHGMAENSWLLIKHKDEFASKEDIIKNERSVLSGKTIEEIKGGQSSYLDKATISEIPEGIKPMLATLVDAPPNGSEWLYEIKWDGYRVLGFVENHKVQLLSRNNQSFTDKYYPITKTLKKWNINCVIDGEIVVLNDSGISVFEDLQNWNSEADGALTLYVFDLLWLDGKSLVNLPLVERRSILENTLPSNDDSIQLSKVFVGKGAEFLAASAELGMEGIIGKKFDSIYLSGTRSKEWLKIKSQNTQEVVIAGFTKKAETSKLFSALILGVYENNQLQYVGKVGTGFSDKQQKEMLEQFKPLITEVTPFKSIPNTSQSSRFNFDVAPAEITWLKPELVAEVSFAEITSEGFFRHPSFKGMRTDKVAIEVIRENKIHVGNRDQIEYKKENQVEDSKLLNSTEDTQEKKVNGHSLKFTNLNKIYWPEDGLTKRDLFNYYDQVAEYILPYLKDRPQSLNRFPDGIHGSSFYQKDVKGKAPDWIKTFPYTTREGEKKEYLVGADEATLLWMVSLGCIEMNPWFSQISTPDHPDYCVIDLDPDTENNTFQQVVEVALVVKAVLDEMDVPAFCKASGSTGMHVYIPLQAKYNYDQSQLFAKLVVTIVQDRLPDLTSMDRMVKSRKGKLYLDFLQNRPGATIACPYSLRPKIGATVSMPLAWEEVKAGLNMKDFNIHNAYDRLKETGDLFKGVLGKGIDLEKIISKAQSLLSNENN